MFYMIQYFSHTPHEANGENKTPYVIHRVKMVKELQKDEASGTSCIIIILDQAYLLGVLSNFL